MKNLLRVSLALGFAVTSLAHAEPMHYPATKTVDHVDEYHGTKVPDPYQWLENDVRTDKDVAAWVENENKVTFGYLNAIPQRGQIKDLVTKLWNYERYSAPSRVGGRYFYTRNDGLQNQSVLYVMDSLDGEGRVLLDPNTLKADGTVAIAGTAVSTSGQYLAYGLAEAGSDWNTWHVRDVDTGKDLPDEVRWVKFSGASWTMDSKGFFYSRYDAPQAGQEYQQLNTFHKLYYHRLGTPQDQDVLVYHRPDQPEWGFGASVTEDGRYVVIATTKGTDDRNRVTYRDLSEPYGGPIELVDNFDNEYTFIANDGPVFYFQTKRDAKSAQPAPKGCIIAIDTRKPQPEHWRTIVPEGADTLQGTNCVANMFVCTYLKDAVTRVRMFTMDGAPVRDVEFPGIGSAGGFGGQRTDTETFYVFSSFAVPPSIYRYNMITGESTLMRQAKVAFDPAEYETKQVFYSSKDGTRVPMFITHRKGIQLNGQNPTLLYGYGGFAIPMTPAFNPGNVAWMELGGVYAVACLRGGGEYGEAWHKAGTKLTKQNVFDDFIAAGEYLISSNYTSPSKLAVLGGSNGGLLVGAVVTQRPDLFGAALPAVGVMDMLKFHTWTAGRFWVDDYGSSANPEEFKALLAYSPYHNIKKGTKYPAVMVTTADTDDRVVPGHSFKFAAALQAAQAGDAPVLIRIETRAGHGAGKPTSKIIEEVADRWAFLVKALNMDARPISR